MKKLNDKFKDQHDVVKNHKNPTRNLTVFLISGAFHLMLIFSFTFYLLNTNINSKSDDIIVISQISPIEDEVNVEKFSTQKNTLNEIQSEDTADFSIKNPEKITVDKQLILSSSEFSIQKTDYVFPSSYDNPKKFMNKFWKNIGLDFLVQEN